MPKLPYYFHCDPETLSLPQLRNAVLFLQNQVKIEKKTISDTHKWLKRLFAATEDVTTPAVKKAKVA
eukprot:8348508-Pyramimonas_sp.AAC.1